MKEKQQIFYEEQQLQLRDMPVGDKLRFSKDGRCLDSFQEALSKWDEIILANNRKIGRDPGQSVAHRAEDYRRKKEVADAFDAIKNDYEKYGSIYWFMTLRKDDEAAIEKMQPYVSKDFPDAFSNTFIDKGASYVEIIRKPENSQVSRFEFSSSGSFKSIGRSEREYLESRLMENDCTSGSI
jgi:hypothetical protein